MNSLNRFRTALALNIVICTAVLALPLPPKLPPVGAYSAGIGFTSLAVFDDPSIIYWNPAALAMMNQMTAELNLTAYTNARPTSWSALAISASPRNDHPLAMGLVRRRSTNWAGEYTSVEFIYPMAFVAKERRFPAGFSVKVQSENYGEKWVYGFRMDGGIGYVTHNQGFKAAISTQNVIGGNLRAFPHESWAGLAFGSDTASFRVSLQCRFDRPFDKEYMSQNYSVGARLRQTDGPFEARGGIIRSGGVVRYATGFGYHNRLSMTLFDAAVIYDPDNGDDRTYYLSIGYTVGSGSPTRIGRPSR